jgi:predicted acetyltransferase
MDVEIRTIEPEEFDTYCLSLETAFTGFIHQDEIDIHRSVTEFDRCLAAVDGGAFVGCAAACSFRVAVPGGADLSLAGITGVGVLPSHRRRGINTALMRRTLDDVVERGEAGAILFASEGGIYPRFGYGVASFMGSMDLATARSAYLTTRRPAGTTRLLEKKEALPRMRAIYEKARPDRPGGVALGENWFAWRFFQSESEQKDGPLFFAIHQSDEGRDDAYAVYRGKHEWPGDVPKLELKVEDVQSTSPEAYADIWRFLLEVDLVDHVTAWNRPADEPLLHMLLEPRRLALRLKDGLYLRIVDMPLALGARTYHADGRIVLEVADPFLPEREGRFELVVERGVGECRRLDGGSADIVCSVNEVGAAYLGGATFRQLARAGRVREERAGALALADAMFAVDAPPWCSFEF